jgi:acetylglutamate kinase
MNETSLLEDTLQDIVFMEQVGIRPILVHGGGPYISERLKSKNVGTEFINGLRVTDADTLGVVNEVFQEINANIRKTLIDKGGNAVSLHGAKDDILFAQKKTFPDDPEMDLGFVGSMDSVNPKQVIALAKAGVVPVISPLARDKSGQLFNVNADTAAAKLAEAMKAEKLVFMSNIAGLLKDPSDPESLLSSLNPQQVKTLMDEGIISGGMLPKVEAALHTLSCGVKKVHIVDGRKHHSLLLEIFTNHGVGTQFVQK